MIMKMDFSLTYTPDVDYNEIGYHSTYTKYYDNILNVGFYESDKEDDWLGRGVYFWDTIGNANWWKKKLSKNEEKCIIKCDLSCKRENYIDLDISMEEFVEFLKNYSLTMENSGKIKPVFKNKKQRRRYYCDIYSAQNNIDIMSHTFEHDAVNEFGFVVGHIERRQICVKNKSCISNIRKGN